MPQHTTGGTRRPSPAPRSLTHDDDPGDEVLAAVLIRMWALASGRTLRRDVPPDQLSAEELIAFWADDMSQPAGRHARRAGSDLAPGAREPGKAGNQAPQPRRRQRRRSGGGPPASGSSRLSTKKEFWPSGP
jgi:hypothetical protein